jgi:hypothetical protein
MRESCAPPEVPEERSKVPGFVSSPAVAMYHNRYNSDISLGSAPTSGCK